MTEEQLAEGQGQEQEAPPAEGQVQDQPPSQQEISPEQQQINRENFLKATGFKSYEEAYKSLKEGQATITKKSQREKELEQELNDANEAINNLAAQSRAPAQAGQAEETDEDFFEKPLEAVDKRIEQKVRQTIRAEQIALDVAEVRGENPEVFDILQRGGFINEAFTKNPTLNFKGKAGLKRAVEDAKGLMRRYSQTVDGIMKPNGAGVTPPPPNETEAEMRSRIMAEQEAATAASLPTGGSARGSNSSREAEIQKAKESNDPERLARVLVEGLQ